MGSSGSAVRGEYCRPLVVQLRGGNAEGALPKLAVREMPQSSWMPHRIRSGRTRAGRNRDHWASSSGARLLTFEVVALSSLRSAAKQGAGAYVYDVWWRHAVVMHRYPRTLA